MSPIEEQPLEEATAELIVDGHGRNATVPTYNDEWNDIPAYVAEWDGVTVPLEDDGNKDIDGTVAVVDNIDDDINDIVLEMGE